MSLIRRRLLPGGNLACEVVPVFAAAEQAHPRLRVWREFEGWWMWQVDDPGGWVIDTNTAATHGEALAVGLAALETASVRTTR